MNVLTADEIKQVEKKAFEGNFTEAGLMLSAGTACFHKIIGYFGEALKTKTTAVICGNGKNAGDGFVIAALLNDYGADAVIVLADKKPVIAEPKRYFEEAVGKGVEVIYFPDYDFECDIKNHNQENI